jgi:transposase
VVVDERGLPVRLALTPGQSSDKAAAPGLLEALPAASVVVADRGYDWQRLIDLVGERGGQAYIPTQRDRKVQRSVDPAIYRKRNLVERFFCKLKHFRRIATRYDKLARNFLAAVALASSRIWMRTYESTT